MNLTETQKTAFLDAIERIKAKGGTGIKIEFEADCNRCDGEEACCGDATCQTCGGNGLVLSGSCASLASVFAHFLMKAGVTGVKDIMDGDYDTDDNYYVEILMPNKWLRYARAYNDHSVDTEITATVNIDTTENALKLFDLIEAFKSVGEKTTSFDVRGAGMHIAVLFTEDASYPNEFTGLSIDGVARRNYAKAMTQLLPALYFLGSSQPNWTRQMNFREPRISVSGVSGTERRKYSAVHFTQGAIEYRVFDTCYDNTDLLADHINVIANSLKYLDTRYRKTHADKVADKSYTFGNNAGYRLERLYQDESLLDMLSLGLKDLKPSYRTIPELKKMRGFKLRKDVLRSRIQRMTDQAKGAYREYTARKEIERRYYAEEKVAQLMRYHIESMTPADITDATLAELRVKVQPTIEDYLESWDRDLTDEETYIERYKANSDIPTGEITVYPIN